VAAGLMPPVGALGAEERPRLGLALSGGAALGLAHVGALVWLEENRVPVDCVAGASMGGLVGGLYAMGMPADEIRRLVLDLDWDEIFGPWPPFRVLTFRRKQDAVDFPGGSRFGLRHGIRWPSGLDPAQPVNLLLSRLALPYSPLRSFDDLPIPFRCVAVDLVRGERVVLGEGSLAMALRATMAVPGLYTPVESEGRVLVDGGLLDNLPVDVARGMGAEVVIAVDVTGPLSESQFARSPLEILNRSVDVVLHQSVRANRERANVIIEPKLEGLGAEDYEAAAALIDAGYEAAAARAAELRRYALKAPEWKAHLAQRRARRRADGFTPRFLQLAGGCVATCRAVTENLRPFIGRPLNVSELETALMALAGQGRIEGLLYEKAETGGEEGLMIFIQEKDYGPPFIHALIDVNGADTDAVQFNVPMRLSMLDFQGSGAELRADVTLGSRTRLAGEYYHPLGGRQWFVAPQALYLREATPWSPLGSSTGAYSTRELGMGLDIGRTYGRASELRLGVWGGHLRVSPRGESTVPLQDGAHSFLSARWTTDIQDSAVIPTRGTRFHVDGRWYFHTPGAAPGFPALQADVSRFSPLGPHETLFLFGSVGVTFTATAPLASRLETISPLRLGLGLDTQPFGSHHLLGGIGYLRGISRLPAPVGRTVYLGVWYARGGVFESWSNARLVGSLGGGVLAETIAGPVFLGTSWSGGTQRIYFSVGRFLKSTAL
jgi:NTE family protein